MKKQGLLILGFMFSLNCFGQNAVFLSDVVKLDLPGNVKKISMDEAIAFAEKQFNNQTRTMVSIENREMDSIYLIENVLVLLHTTNFKSNDNKFTNEGHLTQMKNGFDEWNDRDTTYSSKLEKINNNSVLTENYIVGSVGNYRFYLYNKNSTSTVTGILEFEKTDKDEATAILNHIFQTVSFKE